MASILVIDDEQPIRESLKMILEYEKHEVTLADSGAQGLKLVEGGEFDGVLLDIRMPGMDGMEVLEKIHQGHPDVPVIMISAHGTISTAVEATKKGAFDFIEKPPDRERLLLAVRNLLRQDRLSRENKMLRQRIQKETSILGGSRAILDVMAAVRRVAPTDARVMITGENGTGKELVAHAIHDNSRRAGAMFLDVNCAALPGELIESELFGHEAGAFTGATAKRVGKFEAAGGGTLFLDEIADMPLPAQAKVLRVLEENCVMRLGGSKNIPVDVRVIAATNKNLQELVGKGEFREDLIFRLNVFPIRVPALRERPEDIPLLAKHFLDDFCRRNTLGEKSVGDKAVAKLKAHSWPGNIRELKNLMERLAIVVESAEISEEDVSTQFCVQKPAGGDPFVQCKTYEDFKGLSERMFLESRLKANEWNVSKTAEDIGMPRSNLYKKLEKYGLK